MKHFITAAVCGFGSRGKDAYASYQHLAPDKLKLVAIADPDPEKRDAAVSEYGVAPANCYQNGEELLQQPRLADVLIIATQDRDIISCWKSPSPPAWRSVWNCGRKLMNADVLSLYATFFAMRSFIRQYMNCCRKTFLDRCTPWKPQKILPTGAAKTAVR